MDYYGRLRVHRTHMRLGLVHRFTTGFHGFEFQKCVRYGSLRRIATRFRKPMEDWRMNPWTQVVDGGMKDEALDSGGRWRNEGRTPNTTYFYGFNYMHLGQHLSPWGCMFPILHTFPFQELRIKHIHFHIFGIIFNYYSQGLNPSSLAPLPTFHPPLPYLGFVES
jgi:hypothetical protein